MQIHFLLRDDLVEVHRFLQVGKDGGGFIALLGVAGEGEKQEQDGNDSFHIHHDSIGLVSGYECVDCTDG
jgi:hypothetical protein